MDMHINGKYGMYGVSLPIDSFLKNVRILGTKWLTHGFCPPPLNMGRNFKAKKSLGANIFDNLWHTCQYGGLDKLGGVIFIYLKVYKLYYLRIFMTHFTGNWAKSVQNGPKTDIFDYISKSCH